MLISIYSPTSATSNFPLYPSFFFLSEKALPALLQKDDVDTSSANVHGCTFADGEFLLCKNIAAAWNYRHPWQFLNRFAQKD